MMWLDEVFRHGDRTPVVNFPTDLHKESEWPQGFGQLTKTGMQQLFKLGQYTRERYSNFLNSTYNRQEFYIQSTDYDRTIMSAQSYLSGLFPPTSSQIWNPELLWQPIPVHVLQKSTDQKLHFPLTGCPRFDELQNKTQTSSEFQNRIQPYMGSLGESTCNSDIHNYTLPVWATKDVIDKMEKLAELSLLSLFGLYKTEEKSRLQGGKPVGLEEPGAVAIKKPSEGPFELIRDLCSNVTSFCNVGFGDVFHKVSILEEQVLGRYSIEMHYRNDSSKDPYVLTLPGCTSSCPLEKFAELVSPVITENWSKECGKKDKMKDIFIGFDIAVGLLFIFDLVLLYLLYHYGRCRRRNNYQDI
ncbi:prostatic acid phosphatase-like [Limosa lapponica baueri]|uniref:acid phosphatase n=1 Tax=Limosa lapponica baueri TaxID=1758121 RepID=A0A2I0TIK4_LIMLA|nr:prostatic acid phosphatase-like [Limosa lapponica baueri]